MYIYIYIYYSLRYNVTMLVYTIVYYNTISYNMLQYDMLPPRLPVFRGNHLSNTTCLTHVFFESGE